MRSRGLLRGSGNRRADVEGQSISKEKLALLAFAKKAACTYLHAEDFCGFDGVELFLVVVVIPGKYQEGI